MNVHKILIDTIVYHHRHNMIIRSFKLQSFPGKKYSHTQQSCINEVCYVGKTRFNVISLMPNGLCNIVKAVNF